MQEVCLAMSSKGLEVIVNEVIEKTWEEYKIWTGGRDKLIVEPVHYILHSLQRRIEVGWDTDKKTFSLKVNDIIFEDLQ